MESIPYWETRSYVVIVMKQLLDVRAPVPAPSRRAAARWRLNAWPGFPVSTGQWARSTAVGLRSKRRRIDGDRRSRRVQADQHRPPRPCPTRAGPTRTPRATCLAERIEAAGHRPGRAARSCATTPMPSRRCSTSGSTIPVIDAVISTGGTWPHRPRREPRGDGPRQGEGHRGFGELFRWISFQTIGTSAVQSRACAAVRAEPTSSRFPARTGAVKDGLGPENLLEQLDSRNRPCTLWN